MLELKVNESQLLGGDADPVAEPEFESNFPVDSDVLFDVQFTTGIRWEPEMEDGEPQTIRVQPDPNLHVYEAKVGHIVALAVAVPDPVVFAAFHVSHDDLDGFIERVVAAIDADYDGIGNVTNVHAAAEYEYLREHISETIAELPEE